MTKGTVLDFKTSTSKYTIQYTNGTTASLTKTKLMKVLLPVVNEGAPPELAAQESVLRTEGVDQSESWQCMQPPPDAAEQVQEQLRAETTKRNTK